MRDRGCIFNRENVETVVDERADRRVAAGADALHDNIDILRTVALQFFGERSDDLLRDANGVALRGPPKPSEPAEAHAITLPCASVTVTTVLLYEALMYTLPAWNFLLF
jgi:hypothetical protein